jgi:NAD(P)-dependent dehydrogenase (short-subunit alcohol dehydrogenase family)
MKFASLRNMKTVVITGGNSGIGFYAARFIAMHPDWHVVLACRNPAKAEAALQQLRGIRPDSSASYELLDLFSLRSIQRFTAALERQNLPPVHGLILNAGGFNMKAKSLEFTEDGLERTFQLNFFGHFLLTNLLVKKMEAPARVVFVSSDIHDPAATKMGRLVPPRFGPVEDAAYGRGLFAKMKPIARYGTAKMFAIMCAYEFDRRLRSQGDPKCITINSWSPGVVPTTQMGAAMPTLQKKIITSGRFVRFMGSHLSTDDEAAQALGGLITDAKFAGISGRYFFVAKETLSSAESRDQTKAKAVWEQARDLAKTTNGELIPG